MTTKEEENTVKKMEPVDIAIMTELQRQKKDNLMQLGSLEEYREQMLNDLRQTNARMKENDNKIRKKYDIPADMMWRVGPDNVLEILGPQDVAALA